MYLNGLVFAKRSPGHLHKKEIKGVPGARGRMGKWRQR